MTPANVFQLEIADALGDRRSGALRVGLALLLGSPFVLADMPAAVRAAGLSILIMFVSFFGAAVGQVRRRADGLQERLRLLPLSPRTVVIDSVLAGAAFDLIQVGPLLVLDALVHASTARLSTIVYVAGVLCVSVLLLNALGVLLGASLRGNAEVHLAGALCVGCIAASSGVVPLPARLERLGAWTAIWNPMTRLKLALSGLEANPGQSGRPHSIVYGIALLAVLTMFLVRGLVRQGPGAEATASVRETDME